jgi:hypothetical protein
VSVKFRVISDVTRELAKYRRDLMGVQKVTLDKVALNQQTIFLISMDKSIKIIIWR